MVVSVGSARKRLALFVHGLGGDAKLTWGAFPELLRGDSATADCEIAQYSYPTDLFRIPLISKKSVGIQDLAAALKTEIKHRYSDYDDIFLLCHSLGGLIAKRYIIDIINIGQECRVRKVIFYATPHDGSMLADIGGVISFRHNQLKQLCRNSEFLEQLNLDWIRLCVDEKIDVTYVVGTLDRVVPKESARGFIGNRRTEVVDRGHTDICKPSGPSDIVFLIARNAIGAPLYTQSYASAPRKRSLEDIILFDRYCDEAEPYYQPRVIDRELGGIPTMQGVWLSGDSGVGKTACLMRHASQSVRQWKYATFAAYEIRSAAGVLGAFASELDCLLDGCCPQDISYEGVAQRLRALEEAGVSALLIDEFPMGPTDQERVTAVDAFFRSVLHARQRFGLQIRIEVAAIHSPEPYLGELASKAAEYFSFVRAPQWTSSDIQLLATRCASPLGLTLGKALCDRLSELSEGSPRKLKIELRKIAAQSKAALAVG
ncbi:MAG: esterase/lipase family protein [Bacteroidales bacterium]